uniref:Uncharacterized protein n=1 Tax=Bionectria ochroleuca TaxID=29856 RepID=A0A8H7TNC1_BIOOC
MDADLHALLPPSLLQQAAESWMAITRTEEVPDFGKAVKKMLFSHDDKVSAIRPKVWPALEYISKLGPDHLPDWFSLLPPVDNPDFPTQALGLTMVLDQAPRNFFQGIDQRWVGGYFDDISLGFARSLQKLTPDLRPTSWNRWKDTASFEYFIFARMSFGTPFVHNEHASEEAMAFTDETRTYIEERFNVRDPIREQPERRWDLLGFPKLISSGGPEGEVDIVKGGFWLLELMDVHKPPLDKFGRYPYRNWYLGRDMMAEEEAWIRDAGFFKPPPEEVCRKIREDIEANIWSPLGSGGNPDV